MLYEEDPWDEEYDDTKREVLFIRVDERTKREFQKMFYQLKAEELVDTQCDLIRALIEIYRTRKHILRKILQGREFK